MLTKTFNKVFDKTLSKTRADRGTFLLFLRGIPYLLRIVTRIIARRG
jgi:hypothetical protein